MSNKKTEIYEQLSPELKDEIKRKQNEVDTNTKKYGRVSDLHLRFQMGELFRKGGTKEKAIGHIAKQPLETQKILIKESLTPGTELNTFFAKKRGLFATNYWSGSFKKLLDLYNKLDNGAPLSKPLDYKNAALNIIGSSMKNTSKSSKDEELTQVHPTSPRSKSPTASSTPNSPTSERSEAVPESDVQRIMKKFGSVGYETNIQHIKSQLDLLIKRESETKESAFAFIRNQRPEIQKVLIREAVTSGTELNMFFAKKRGFFDTKEWSGSFKKLLDLLPREDKPPLKTAQDYKKAIQELVQENSSAPPTPKGK